MPLPKNRMPDFYEVIPASAAPALPHGRFPSYLVFLDANGQAIDMVSLATTSTAGTVKKAATQAASTASDVAGVVADLNALISKLKAAGIMA